MHELLQQLATVINFQVKTVFHLNFFLPNLKQLSHKFSRWVTWEKCTPTFSLDENTVLKEFCGSAAHFGRELSFSTCKRKLFKFMSSY